MDQFSGERYRLMESIFSWDEDIAFLASLPGYNPRIGRRHRIAKQRLAREWLGELRAEFEKVYSLGLWMVVHSDVDRPDLCRTLWRLKVAFYRTFVIVRLRLAWSAPVADEIRFLTIALEHMIAYSRVIRGQSSFAGA